MSMFKEQKKYDMIFEEEHETIDSPKSTKINFARSQKEFQQHSFHQQKDTSNIAPNAGQLLINKRYDSGEQYRIQQVVNK